MALLFLGLIIIISGFMLSKTNNPNAKYAGLLKIGGIFVMVISLALAMVRIIPPGHVGVKILFGSVQNEVIYEGLNFVNPLIQIEEFTTRTKNYTMSSTENEGQVKGGDAIRILSNDGLDVIIDLTILYRMKATSAPDIMRKIGPDFENIIIRPVTRTGIRNSAAQFNAIELFAEKRNEFEAEILSSIADTMARRGFLLEQVLVREITLPNKVKESIERKITAIQEAERMQYVLDKEKSEAERRRVEARGIADAQNIINESLTSKLLQFEKIKMQRELASSANAKIIIMDGKNSPPIFMNSK